ncbi:ImmA/IrrE family metallo-endopeptidase [Bacillus badius]|nr:ImmA/IrrE family metallo-endopeptidase [Bacillus badius]MED4718247.1 ImmA/IrrE family metallo-endopeptidase [Bacillus badius]
MAHSTLLEDYVFSLYQSLRISEPSQLTIDLISRRLGVEVEYADASSKTVHAPQEVFILIDRRLSPEKQWQDFSHELGHLLRHCGNQLSLPSPFLKMQEWQADNFMYHFCVPTFMLEKVEFPWRKQEVISKIAQTFNVELEFAAKRLERWLRKKEELHFYSYLSNHKMHV